MYKRQGLEEDIDKIIQIFLKDNQVPAAVKDYLALLARNMVRFVDNKIRFERIERIHTYTSKYIASQCFIGDDRYYGHELHSHERKYSPNRSLDYPYPA